MGSQRDFGRGTLLTAADLSAKVGYGGKLSSGKIALAGANEGIGVITDGGSGTDTPGRLSRGECLCVAGAAVALDAFIVTNASGKWITAASGDEPVGRAMSVATGDGNQFIADIYGAVDESIA